MGIGMPHGGMVRGRHNPQRGIHPSPPAMEGQGGKRDVMWGYGRAETPPLRGACTRVSPAVEEPCGDRHMGVWYKGHISR